MELETEREDGARAMPDAAAEAAGGQADTTDGRTNDATWAEGAPETDDVPLEEVAWRALPALGDGLLRLVAAFGVGLLTGIAWNVVGRVPPSGFVAALGWAAALCGPTLLAIAAGVALDGGLRPHILHGRPVRLLAEVVIGMALLILAIGVEATITDLSPLAVPSTLALALGLGLGFGLGGMRLRGMSGDARWLFAGLGVASLFGLALPF